MDDNSAAAKSPRPALWSRSLSGLGLMLGALCFAASLTPSLIPRDFPIQGVLGGAAFAFGYGVGGLLEAVWLYLGLPVLRNRTRRLADYAGAAVALVVVLGFLSRVADWQNSIRERMGMAPVDSARPIEVALIAVVVFLLLLLLGRLIGSIYRLAERKAARVLPLRAARAIGLAATVVLTVLLVDGVLVRAFFDASDASFRALDAVIEPETAPPANGPGGPGSLLTWEGLGRAGREFIAGGPTRSQIETFLGRPGLQPVRVYAGLNSAGTPEARAQLALDELIRMGGFDRAVLVVATPTGTGWMDPEAMNGLEYLHGGDSAIVGMQYSYLSSWISLLVEPGYAETAGRTLFRTVYQYWTKLPKDARPRLYLFGLSLGAYGSEKSLRLTEILADPIQGALWSGPPFSTPGWRSATAERTPGSPEWLPRYGDGSAVRFTNQDNHLDTPGASWGPLRMVYLQYASDPVTFFSPESFWRKPDWMTDPVGPDVSPELRWYPGVTFLQLLLDMAIALWVPMGYGHLFAPEHYIDAWIAVTEPPGWSPAEIDRLKTHLRSDE